MSLIQWLEKTLSGRIHTIEEVDSFIKMYPQHEKLLEYFKEHGGVDALYILLYRVDKENKTLDTMKRWSKII
jgi:hypothetical protein